MALAAIRSRVASTARIDYFREWGKGMSDDLALMGLVLVPQTGSWTWATDLRIVTDGAITTGTAILTSATATFTSGDVGKRIQVEGAGSSGAALKTTILTFTNSTTVVLAANASTTVSSGGIVGIGAQVPGTNTAATGVWEIWRFDDSLQSTLPVYFKIEYGTGNSSTGDTGIFLTVGTTVDGAGNLAGQVISRRQIAVNSSNNATSTNNYFFCGSNNRVFVLAQYNLSAMWGFSIEREHDATGADVGTGICLITIEMSNTIGSQYIASSGTVASWQQKLNCMHPVGATSGAEGTRLNMYPVFFKKLGSFTNPSFNILIYFNADVTAGSQDSFAHYGSNHNYYFIGHAQAPGDLVLNGTSSLRIAGRFE